jgi:hypothetical protein
MMTLVVEGVVGRSVDKQKALGRADRFEALHLALASSDGLMGVLGAVVGSQPLIMNAAQTEASKRAAIGSQLVGCDLGGPYTEPLEELLDQLRGDLGISATMKSKTPQNGQTETVAAIPA